MNTHTYKKIICLILAAVLLSGASNALAQDANGSDLGGTATSNGSSGGSVTSTGPTGGSVTSTGPSTAPATTNSTLTTLQNPLSSQYNSVGSLVNGFVVIFSYIVILFAVLALVWVGAQFIFAQGNPERLNELKRWLLWIVIGVAVVIGARVIITIVINTLQATGTVNSNVIQSAQNALPLQGN